MIAGNGTPGLGDLPSDAELEQLGTSLDAVRAEFPFTLELTSPVTGHGETLTALTLQMPTGNDLFHSGGDPFVDGVGKPTDLRRLFALVSRIAGVPESTVKQLSVQDLKNIEFALTPLFQPSPAKLKRIFSILRTSGGISVP
jgi:hypothetical protein